jgi:hypothetical protein
VKERFYLDLYTAAPDEDRASFARLAVRAYPTDERGLRFLTTECTEIDAFEREVAALKGELDRLLAEAREALQALQAPEIAAEPRSAAEMWQALERCATFEEMRERFNAMDMDRRQDVANYVFTQLNIFKDAASRFSQHYIEDQVLLAE